jgi:hypothetical protein
VGGLENCNKLLTCNWKGFPSSFGSCPEVERVAAEVFKKTSKSQDVVGESREPGRGCPVKEPPDFQSGESQGFGKEPYQGLRSTWQQFNQWVFLPEVFVCPKA